MPSFSSNMYNLFGRNPFDPESVANLSDAAFNAADAASMASSGMSESAIAQNLGAAGIEDADFMAADSWNMAQQGMGQDAMADSLASDFGTPDSFDVAGMAGALAKGLKAFGGDSGGPKAPAAPTGSIISQPMRTGSAAPVAQPKQAIGQAAPVSNAMQTIQNQNLGSVPTIQDVLKMRQLGLR